MAVKSHKLLSLVGLSLAISFPSVSHAASGGPDGYGYYYIDSNASGGPSYNANVFTNATSGTLLTTASNADDTSESMVLPFSFSFYGTSYSTLYACSDGYVATTSTCTLTNATLSSNTQPMMAPFWDDLDTRGAGEVYTYTTGSSPNRVFNVVFLNNTHFSNTSNYGNISFAVQLYETTNDIVFQYSDVVTENSTSYSYGLSATVGIDGGSTTTYNTQLSYNVATYLTNSLATRFTTGTPIARPMALTRPQKAAPPQFLQLDHRQHWAVSAVMPMIAPMTAPTRSRVAPPAPMLVPTPIMALTQPKYGSPIPMASRLRIPLL